MDDQFSQQYWTARYLAKETSWDTGSITTPLKAYIDQLKNKHLGIFLPGAGNAYEAEYLLHAGFKNVTVIDISPEPIKNIQKRVPEFNEKQLLLGDFFEHTGTYDLIIEQTFFCALDPVLRTKYAEHLFTLLKPGGKLAGVLFKEPLQATHPPFGATVEEYTQLFMPRFTIKKLEPCYNSIKPRQGRELFVILQKDVFSET